MTSASAIFLASIPALISLYTNQFLQHDQEIWKKQILSPIRPTDNFDFIVVGAGAAGCVVARRLAEENFTVLLLEAGGNPPPILETPLVTTFTTDLPQINYNFISTKQQNAGLANGGRIRIPAGKMMGGSTAESHMIFERGPPADYDEWAELTRDSSWKYEDLVPYFEKAELQMAGNRSLLDENSTIKNEKNDPWIQAGLEQGFRSIKWDSPIRSGFNYTRFLTQSGRRVNAYQAYIADFEIQSPYLTVSRYSDVSEVIIRDKRATGVKYERHGAAYEAFALHEIILTAGTYMTPTILIQSGIGPENQLKQAKIEPVSFTPVGENLQDHLKLEIGPFHVNPSETWNLQDNLTDLDLKTYDQNHDGPLSASLEFGQTFAYLSSSRAKLNDKKFNRPDLQVFYQNLDNETRGVKCEIVLSRPCSRGRLFLGPHESPVKHPRSIQLDLGYLTNTSDIDVIIEGVQFCFHKLEHTKVFKRLGARYKGLPYRPCSHRSFRSKEYWKCYIRHTVESAYHSAGTCRMGHLDHQDTVVDSELKVKGVLSLRVGDASVMPVIPVAATALPTMMVAEKLAASLIFEYRNVSKIMLPQPLTVSEGIKRNSDRSLGYEIPHSPAGYDPWLQLHPYSIPIYSYPPVDYRPIIQPVPYIQPYFWYPSPQKRNRKKSWKGKSGYEDPQFAKKRFQKAKTVDIAPNKDAEEHTNLENEDDGQEIHQTTLPSKHRGRTLQTTSVPVKTVTDPTKSSKKATLKPILDRVYQKIQHNGSETSVPKQDRRRQKTATTQTARQITGQHNEDHNSTSSFTKLSFISALTNRPHRHSLQQTTTSNWTPANSQDIHESYAKSVTSDSQDIPGTTTPSVVHEDNATTANSIGDHHSPQHESQSIINTFATTESSSLASVDPHVHTDEHSHARTKPSGRIALPLKQSTESYVETTSVSLVSEVTAEATTASVGDDDNVTTGVSISDDRSSQHESRSDINTFATTDSISLTSVDPHHHTEERSETGTNPSGRIHSLMKQSKWSYTETTSISSVSQDITEATTASIVQEVELATVVSIDDGHSSKPENQSIISTFETNEPSSLASVSPHDQTDEYTHTPTKPSGRIASPLKQSTESYTGTTPISSASQDIAETATSSVVNEDDATTGNSLGHDISTFATTESTSLTPVDPLHHTDEHPETHTNTSVRKASPLKHATESYTEATSIALVSEVIVEATTTSTIHEDKVTTDISIGDDHSSPHENHSDISTFATTEPSSLASVGPHDQTDEHSQARTKPSGRIALPLKQSTESYVETTSVSSVSEVTAEETTASVGYDDNVTKGVSISDDRSSQHDSRSDINTFATTDSTSLTSVDPHHHTDERSETRTNPSGRIASPLKLSTEGSAETTSDSSFPQDTAEPTTAFVIQADDVAKVVSIDDGYSSEHESHSSISTFLTTQSDSLTSVHPYDHAEEHSESYFKSNELLASPLKQSTESYTETTSVSDVQDIAEATTAPVVQEVDLTTVVSIDDGHSSRHGNQPIISTFATTDSTSFTSVDPHDHKDTDEHPEMHTNPSGRIALPLKQNTESYTETTSLASVSKDIAEAAITSVDHEDNAITGDSIGDDHSSPHESHSDISTFTTTEPSSLASVSPRDQTDEHPETLANPSGRISSPLKHTTESYTEAASIALVSEVIVEATTASTIHEDKVTTDISIGDDHSSPHENQSDISAFATTDPSSLASVSSHDQTDEHSQARTKPSVPIPLPLKQSKETEKTPESSVPKGIAETATASVDHEDNATTGNSIGDDHSIPHESHSDISTFATTESTSSTSVDIHYHTDEHLETHANPSGRIALHLKQETESYTETTSIESVPKDIAEAATASVDHEDNATTVVSIGDVHLSQNECHSSISPFQTTQSISLTSTVHLHDFKNEHNAASNTHGRRTISPHNQTSEGDAGTTPVSSVNEATLETTAEHLETSNKPSGRIALPLHPSSESDGHSEATSISAVTEPTLERTPTSPVNEGDLVTKMSADQNLHQHENRSGLSTLATTEPTLGTSVKPHYYMDEHHDSEPETRNDGSADEGRGRVPDMTGSTVPYVRFSKDKVVYFVPSSPTSLANPRAWEQFAYIPATSPQPQLEGEGSNGNVDLDQGDEGESEGTFSKDRAIEPEETLW